MTVKLNTLAGHNAQVGDVVLYHADGNPRHPTSPERTITSVECGTYRATCPELGPKESCCDQPFWSVVRRASQTAAPPTNPFIVERIEREIKRGTIDDITVKAINFKFINVEINDGKYTPSQLRALAKQLTDLADAHEAVYSPPSPVVSAC